MTQTNTQSVRNDAEAAVNTNRVPTFEEVYAMPYVQDSIRALIDQNVRQYPLLASYADDLRQEMLIALNAALPYYDGRAGIDTFCRTCLENGIKMARRQHFRERNLQFSYARDIADFDDIDDESRKISLDDIRAFASICRCDAEDKVLCNDILAAIDALPANLKKVALWLIKGYSLRNIERMTGIPFSRLRRKYLLPIRLYVSRKVF